MRRCRIPFLLLFLLGTSSCGTLIGNVKPVVEKSQSYGVLDLSKANPDWKKLPAQSQNAAGNPDLPDVAYQSEKTASIISLDSACRPTFATENRDLHAFTEQLLLGISDVTHRDETATTLQGAPALETTIEGKLNGENMALKAVVIHRAECVYDLMYVARPDHFAENEGDFSQFVASLRLKE